MAKKKAAKKSASGGIKLQPLGDRVVVERDESEEVTSGGIVLPDSAKDKPSRGRIVSVGDGRLLGDGSRAKPQVKVRDRVLFSSYAGDTFTIGDRELLLMSEEDILAVINLDCVGSGPDLVIPSASLNVTTRRGRTEVDPMLQGYLVDAARELGTDPVTASS